MILQNDDIIGFSDEDDNANDKKPEQKIEDFEPEKIQYPDKSKPLQKQKMEPQ